MGQFSSKVWDPRRPKPLSKTLHPLIISFTRDVGYVPPSKIDYSILAEAVEKRAILTGVPFLPGDDDHSSKCFRTGLIITTVRPYILIHWFYSHK